jgi:hypothetical protein
MGGPFAGPMSLEHNLQVAITSHERWKAKLAAAIENGSAGMEIADVCRDDVCPFGQWLYGWTLTPAARLDPSYIIVQFLHANFHECAGRVVRLLSEGKDAEARALMASDGEYVKISDQLVAALLSWIRSCRHSA